jgi:hypothetical protein
MRISPKQLLQGLLYLAPFTLFALASCGGGGGGSSGAAATISATATPTAQLLTENSTIASFSPLTASGGATPYTYSYSGPLPIGLTFHTDTGVVTGMPTLANAAVPVTFSVKDANNVVASTTSTVNFTVFAAWPGTIEFGTATGTATTLGLSAATDASGNIYVAGYTTGDLSGSGLTGNTDMFLTKYNATGTKIYTNQLGFSATGTHGNAVATDASGNVFVAGDTTGNLGASLAGTTDMFLTEYDSNGNGIGTQQLGVSGNDTFGYAVATDASGNIYVAGSTTGGLDSNAVTGSTDMFLTKYNAGMGKVYTKQLGATTQDTYGKSVATDASGNIYVAGYTTGNLDGLHPTVSFDMFLTKYTASGTWVYTRQLGISVNDTYGSAVATDASGNVYVTGNTTGNLVSGSGASTGAIDMFLTKYTASGTKVYTRQLGVSGTSTYGISVATDAYGNVYVSGNTTADFTSNTSLPASTSDFFLTKYNASGTKVYTQQLGVTGTNTSGNAVATYANGNVFVAGDTTGALDGGTLTGSQDFFLTKYGADGIKQP